MIIKQLLELAAELNVSLPETALIYEKANEDGQTALLFISFENFSHYAHELTGPDIKFYQLMMVDSVNLTKLWDKSVSTSSTTPALLRASLRNLLFLEKENLIRLQGKKKKEFLTLSQVFLEMKGRRILRAPTPTLVRRPISEPVSVYGGVTTVEDSGVGMTAILCGPLTDLCGLTVTCAPLTTSCPT